MNDIKKELVEEIHKSARRNYPRRSVTLKGIGDLWQADLVEMIPHARVNSGYRYLLTVIDCFTKFAWAKPVKTKKANDIAEAFEYILNEASKSLATPIPKNLQTDNGTEFYNDVFSKLMKRFKINHYSSFSTVKSSIIERFNRSLKTVMYKKFSLNGNYKWVDMLPDLMHVYNNSVHRTIGMKPAQVKRSHEKRLLQKFRNLENQKDWIKPKFKVGDYVRISKQKSIFEKGYTPNWTTELFRVSKVQNTTPPTFILKDLQGEDIKGGFYTEELQKSKNRDVYLVEKVIRKRGNQAYVKWLGFDSTHNSWIPIEDILSS